MKSGVLLSENSKYMVFNKSSYEDILENRKKVVNNINSQLYNIPCESYSLLNIQEEKDTENLLPIICIINGAGKNGKDTLISMMDNYLTMYNFDSVGEVKYVVDTMLSMEDSAIDTGAKNHKTSKDNVYRSFLHDVKMAWSKYTNGSLVMSIGKLKAVLIGESTYNYDHSIDIIFFHIREPEEIEKMKKICEKKFGLMCITMLVKGLVDPSEYDNDGDRNVMNYNYDIIIQNDPNQLNSLEKTAKCFSKALVNSNILFGFSKSDLVILPEDETGEKLIEKNKKFLEVN